MNQHLFAPALLLSALLSVACAGSGPARGQTPRPATPAAADRPNILFIISDDLTASALSCYGNRQCQTPNIDRLAAEGTRFTRAYCQFPVCGPSRAAIMSGMYAQAIGVTSNGASSKFAANMGKRPSMSQHFIQNGYYAARVSKIYHMRVPGDITAGVDGPDHGASWTERFNCKAPEWMSKGEHQHLTNEKLKRDPDKHYGLGFGGAFYVVKTSTDGSEQPDQMAADKAIEILSRKHDKPFFLAVGLVRPHVPLVAPQDFFAPYPSESMKLMPRIDNDWDDIPRPGISKNARSIGLAGQPAKQKKVLSAYYASVAYMDAQVGRILKALQEQGLRDKTIVVFCSDHGYHLGEHDFWQKMSTHEQSTRIPLIIAAPGGAPAVSDSLVEQIDIYPTLSQMAGLPIPPHCQGRSLVPILADPTHTVRQAAYTLRGRDHVLRTDRWAFIKYRDGSEELYDMKRDPGQFTNLAKPNQRRTIELFMGGLNRKLEAIRVEGPSPPVQFDFSVPQ